MDVYKGIYRNKLQWTIFFVLLFLSILGVLFGSITVKILGLALLVLILSGIKIILEYERVVLFTLGRYTGLLGPGIIWIIPIIQTERKIDLRIQAVDITPQEVVTKDNVPIKVDGVVFFRVEYPEKAILNVEDYKKATVLYAQTVLRDVIGNIELDEILQKREEIAEKIRKIVDEAAEKFGVDVVNLKLQNITIPDDLKAAISKQAAAEREKRALIIRSEGEVVAAENIRKAAEILSENRDAILLRVLDTLRDISNTPSEKIVLLLPFDLFRKL